MKTKDKKDKNKNRHCGTALAMLRGCVGLKAHPTVLLCDGRINDE
jgi:hypothetical protein